MIRHHPPAEILEDYARGALLPGAALVVACHLHDCALCRGDAATWESVGGAFLEASPGAAIADDALQHVFARIDGADAANPAPDRLPKFLERFDVPAPLRAWEVGFRRWVTPNIWFAPVLHADAGTDARTYLVYARRNTRLAEHTHRGQEMTLVLHGSFGDDCGTFSPGDLAVTNDDILHSPTVTADGECLCLINADAPMALSGSIARTIQFLAGNLY